MEWLLLDPLINELNKSVLNDLLQKPFQIHLLIINMFIFMPYVSSLLFYVYPALFINISNYLYYYLN
jgi:hypothetical protein